MCSSAGVVRSTLNGDDPLAIWSFRFCCNLFEQIGWPDARGDICRIVSSVAFCRARKEGCRRVNYSAMSLGSTVVPTEAESPAVARALKRSGVEQPSCY